MKLGFYQLEVALGTASAALLCLLRNAPPVKAGGQLITALEAAAFGLCALGMISGANDLKAQYVALGSNLDVARADPGYRRARLGVQIAGAFAAGAVGSLAAARSGMDPAQGGLGVLIGMSVLFPVLNRLSGWG